MKKQSTTGATTTNASRKARKGGTAGEPAQGALDIGTTPETFTAPPVDGEAHTLGNGAGAAQVEAVMSTAAAAGGERIGFLMSWNAGSLKDVSRVDARTAFSAAQVEKFLPETLAPSTALTRAASSGKATAGYTVEAAESADGVFFVYRVTPGQGEAGDTYAAAARVKVDAAGAIVSLPPEGVNAAAADATGMEWARDIAKRAARLVTHVEARDVSTALTKIAGDWRTAPLRAIGGIYFAPESRYAQWTALAAGLATIGFAPITVDMVSSPANVGTAGAAVAGALESELGDLAEDLDRATGGMLAKTLEARVTEAEDIIARVAMYRGVLLDAADGLEAKAADMKLAFQAALDKETAERAQKTAKAAPTPNTHRAVMSAAGYKAWRTRLVNSAAAGDTRAQAKLAEMDAAPASTPAPAAEQAAA